jgi:hypothetical protein
MNTSDRPAKRWLARSLRNPDNLPAFLVALFTFLLAVFAIFAWVETRLGTRALQDQLRVLRDDQRAWIALRGAEITRPAQRGETLEFEVIYENTGKQPAFNVAHQNSIGVMDVPLDARGTAYWEHMMLPQNAVCDTLETINTKASWIGKTAFPGQRYRDVAYIFTDPKGIPDEFLARKSTFWVQGCIAYKTLGKFWFSPYCLYLYPAKDIPPEKWPFRFCASGNEAKSPD